MWIRRGAFDLFDIKWRDSTTSNTSWALSDGNWKTNATAYQHLADEYNDVDTLHLYEWHNSDSTKLIYLKIAVSTDAHSNEPVYNAEGVQIGVLFGYTATQVIYDGVYYDCDDSVGQDVKEAYADTIGGTTITYYLAADGHKIVLVDNKTDVDTVYANNSVAWYYILDTANQRFMLPRVDSLTQDLMTIAPIITGVDNTESLKWADKNGTGIGGNRALGVYGGTTNDTGVATNSSYNNTPTLTLNLKPTNLYAGLNSATGLFAGKMYLYFYVGA